MIRITPEESIHYIPLISGDPHLCKKAIAFTLTPCLTPGWAGWEDVTYYTDNSIPAYQLHPLEVMYDQWKGLDLKENLEKLKENRSDEEK
jgi:hypothetical protein